METFAASADRKETPEPAGRPHGHRPAAARPGNGIPGGMAAGGGERGGMTAGGRSNSLHLVAGRKAASQLAIPPRPLSRSDVNG